MVHMISPSRFGSVVAGQWPRFAGGGASGRSTQGSRSQRPVATTWRNSRPPCTSARWAVSSAPRASMRRSTASTSGAVRAESGRVPIHGNTSRSRRRMMRSLCVAAPVGANFANHSRATTSKLSAGLFVRAAFWALRFSPGSMPSASSLRASSRRWRASFRPTVGYTPTERRFSFPATRYFSRHHLPPAGLISRYRPPPSKRRTGFSAGRAVRTAMSVRGALHAEAAGNRDLGAGFCPRCCPRVAPAVNESGGYPAGPSPTKKPAFPRASVCRRTPASIELVELRGIEPLTSALRTRRSPS